MQTEWAKFLPPLLNAKAAKCYSHLTIDESNNFVFVKKTILTSFRLTPVTYLQKFKSITRSGSETYKLFGNRLEDLFSYYLNSKEISDFDGLREDMILQQFLLSLPPAVKSFVEARAPTNLASATSLADLCFEISARDTGSNHKFGVNRRVNYQIIFMFKPRTLSILNFSMVVLTLFW